MKRLDAKCYSPWLELMLVALQSLHTCLEKVDVGVPVPSVAIFLLSIFHSITQCTLQSSETVSLDLRPLSALPLLTNLCFQHGRFSGLEAAGHLTMLSMIDAEATCLHECCCVTSLVRLTLVGTRLMRFHRRHVAACSKLQSLTLIHACIGAPDVEEEFNLLDQDGDKVPSGLSALTALTSLRLDFDSSHVLDG